MEEERVEHETLLKKVDWIRLGLRTHLPWGRDSKRKDGDTNQRGVSSCVELRRELWLQIQEESKSNK